MKYIDPSGYFYQRFMEIFAMEQKDNQPSQMFNIYPLGWADYVGTISHSNTNYAGAWELYQEAKRGGYGESFIIFNSRLAEQINIPFSLNSAKSFTWHTWINSNYYDIVNHEVIISSEKVFHTVALNPSGGEGSGWVNDAKNINTGLGVGSGVFGGNYGLTANQTFRYAQRINGRFVSAAELTATNQAKALKVLNASKSIGNKLGVAGGLVIAGDVLYNSEVKASNGINAVMTGIAFTGYGAPVAGIWFVADFGTWLITGKSISDRIDSGVGAPLVDWDW